MTTNRRPYLFPDKMAWVPMLNYAAGLFDGEGSVSLSVCAGHSGVLVAYIANTDPRVTEWLYQHFGGGVGAHIRNDGHRTLFTWVLHGREAIQFLKDIRHRLIVKRAHADLVCSTFLSVTKDRKRLLELEAKLKELNAGAEVIPMAANISRWVHRGNPKAERSRAIVSAGKPCQRCGKIIRVSPKYGAVYLSYRRFCSRSCATYAWHSRNDVAHMKDEVLLRTEQFR